MLRKSVVTHFGMRSFSLSLSALICVMWCSISFTTISCNFNSKNNRKCQTFLLKPMKKYPCLSQNKQHKIIDKRSFILGLNETFWYFSIFLSLPVMDFMSKMTWILALSVYTCEFSPSSCDFSALSASVKVKVICITKPTFQMSSFSHE